MNPSLLSPAMGKYSDTLSSLPLVKQSVQEKESLIKKSEEYCLENLWHHSTVISSSQKFGWFYTSLYHHKQITCVSSLAVQIIFN